MGAMMFFTRGEASGPEWQKPLITSTAMMATPAGSAATLESARAGSAGFPLGHIVEKRFALAKEGGGVHG